MKTFTIDAPAEMKEVVTELGKCLSETLPAGVGFALVLFDFGTEGWATYCSNGSRDGVTQLLRQMAEHLDASGMPRGTRS